ncbi:MULTISPECIES: DNA double-strand break repair ATPase Rad50 [Halolamina]|uniref:DNA double-strand break repair Rad50 ATPase n=1 Tax=Halolamina pelagica TaxID=699431 RepID=A0A1I5R3N9_9EURY|nr:MULTISPECIES: DNA double-strand break repair ATPase Rad50 [Halolamina]NHX35674.1 DNA double-strand break repair ATPase Rad50 [Halolamina sp. R1-12]SFP53164.1 exonuclease SbcC [Halolamina pelagica]
MKFDRLRLRNFKPYADTDLRFEDGVTVIHGLNGSGKSSLLEACFFALYGSRALDGTLDDAVTTGADETDVELWFTHAGEEFKITRELRRSGDSISTRTCTLDGPDGVVEGARDVREFVGEDLLRMDSDSFRNCAYIRQGEVNRLINASPRERREMIDDLLQLGKLEEYRERASDARLGVEDVLSDKRGGLNKLDEQIAAKEAKDLHDRLNELESDLAALDDEIERFEGNREDARETKEEAESIIEQAEERESELEELSGEIEELEASIRETESEREALLEEITELRERIEERESELEALADDAGIGAATADAVADARETIDDREADLREQRQEQRDEVRARESEAESLANEARRLREDAGEKHERADELEREADGDEADLEEVRADLEEVVEEREAIESRFADAPVEIGEADAHRETLREELDEVQAEIEETVGTLASARDRVEEAEELLEEGNCPECGQPVEDSPHVDSLESDRERVEELSAELGRLNGRKADLKAEIEDAEALTDAESRAQTLAERREMLEARVDELEAEIEADRAATEELREEADELEAEAEETEAEAEETEAEAEQARNRVGELDEELDDLEERRERLDAVADALDAIDDDEDEIERLREKRESKAELADERRDRLEALRERRDELREQFDRDRVEDARTQRDDAADYLEKVEAKLDSLAERRDELTGQIGSVEKEIQELEALRADREELAETVADLESLHEETERLEQTYGDLRAELRQRNVETLERMLNETFDLAYGNDAYSHIELDGEYDLTVYQKDGTPLSPEQLSGGERALFNLSLRCAIYRLLSEGIEGAAPTPPLILDEPTVFLDSGHVSRLVNLVEEMRGFGVRQILIVSHDEELVDAADELVTVEKDTTTNRSTARREDAATLARAEAILEGDD